MVPSTPSSLFDAIANLNIECSPATPADSFLHPELAALSIGTDLTDNFMNHAPSSSVLENGYTVDLNADLYLTAQLMNDEMEDTVTITLQDATPLSAEVLNDTQPATQELPKGKRKRSSRSDKSKAKSRRTDPLPFSSSTRNSRPTATRHDHRIKIKPLCISRGHAVETCSRPYCRHFHNPQYMDKRHCGCGSCAIDKIRSWRDCQMCKARKYFMNADTNEVWFFPTGPPYETNKRAAARIHLYSFSRLRHLVGLPSEAESIVFHSQAELKRDKSLRRCEGSCVGRLKLCPACHELEKTCEEVELTSEEIGIEWEILKRFCEDYRDFLPPPQFLKDGDLVDPRTLRS